MMGATVLNKQSNAKTVSDSAGIFSIAASPGNVLMFSYIGFLNYEITLSTEAFLTIPLTETMLKLNDVVVKTGQGTGLGLSLSYDIEKHMEEK